MKVQLKQPMYVNQVVLVLKKSCCDEKVNLRVTLEDKNKKATGCSSVSSFVIDNRLDYNCAIVFPSIDVILTRIKKNSTLQICEVQVYELGNCKNYISKLENINIPILK